MAVIGIDLGTTNSLAAYWDDEGPKLIPNALGEYITPSVVGLSDEGDVLVGKAAKERLQTHPELTASAFKRFMGTDKRVTLGRKKTFRAEELSSLVIRSLKEDAENHLGCEITEAVISVPAYFSDAQRKATKAAGMLAGLKVDRLINEPTAAAIAYGLHKAESEDMFLVFDLGGGTFDVSVLEIFDNVMQVHASSGDNFLGGEDFVDMLAEHFADKHNIGMRELKGNELNDLRVAAERCKCRLSSSTSSRMKFVYRNEEYESEFTRQEFESICIPLIKRLRFPVERALKDASLSVNDLNAIILVGGASRMPLVRSLAAKMLGKLPYGHINPDEVVALGAAVQAGLISRRAGLEDVVLTDVAPYSLGTGVVNPASDNPDDLLYHPIIERNSPVPLSRSDTLYTVRDYQTLIQIDIYQGESRLVRDNIKLGEIQLPVPKARAGEQSVEVRFTYDISGLLEVEGKVTQTGHRESITIEGNPGVMTPEEIEKRLKELAHLKIHPRDKAENTVLIARGERLYQESLGELRQYIQSIISQFEKVLSRQIPSEIEEARREFSRILDELERQRGL